MRRIRCRDVRDDRGAISVVMVMLVLVVFAGAALIVDGGRIMVARRHASNIAEGAARAAVAIATPMSGFDQTRAAQTAIDHAHRAGIAFEDIEVEVTADHVTVTITERRSTVFLVLGGMSTVTIRASGTARLAYSP